MDSELYEFSKKIVDHRTRLETIEDMLGIARKVDEPKIKVHAPTSPRSREKPRPSTEIDLRQSVKKGWSQGDEVTPPAKLPPGKASLKRIRNRSSRLMGMNPTKKKKKKQTKKLKKLKKGSKKR